MRSSGKLLMLLGLMVTLLAATAVAAGITGHDFRDDGMGNELIAVRTLLKLKLTEAQQTRMLIIFAKYQDEIQNLQDNMQQAQQKLSAAVHADQYNENDVRQAFNEMSMITEEQAEIKAKIMVELRPVLTSEQVRFLKDQISNSDIEMMKQLKTRWD